MSKLDDQILGSLAELPEGKTSVNTYELAKTLGVDHQVIVGAAKSLAADNYIVTETSSETIQHWNISKEAEAILKDGSPEYQLFQYLKAHGQGDKHAVPHAELQEKFGAPVAAVGLANGIKAKVLQLNKADGVSTVCLSATEMEDTVRSVLQAAKEGKPVDPKDVKELKRRKLATLGEMATFTLTRGEKYEPKRGERTVGDLNPKMLQDGSWKTANFRKYNFKDPAPEVDGGQLHPLLKTRQEFREIMMELGFQEMNTQHWVESSFWNFDSLFIPQQHPARDVQDTFFMSKPATCQIENRELLEKVKSTHERAFRNAWSEAESSRNVLRTHTTGTSAYTLYRLAQMSSVDEQGRTMFKPGRYFSIDRVFRNEQMDRTHLCEFHQVEGFVIGRDISLAKMMHTFNKFFRRIGVEKLRFKPAFNPYTEPSMEVFGYHTGLQKWIEVGNSGLFRPELLGPLGFDEGVSVMAWGLSLERPTMIKYGINSIHELFGHRVDVKFIKRSAIARF